MASDRTILHVDMDAFFASVEQLDNPLLRGRPVLVGHDGARGVVAAASYEARVFGCRSAQPMAVASRLCPHAIVAPVRFGRYRELSSRVFERFADLTPQIEPLSIDEAFLDVTGSLRLLGPAEGMARRLKERIRETTGLTASVGVAPNKFLAKLASDLQKPDGLVIVTQESAQALLEPLEVTRIFGVGPKTAARLEGAGIRTIGDLRRCPLELLRRRIGDEADRYQRLALGMDERPVVSDREAKSIGQEQTFGENLVDPGDVTDVMLQQAEQVGERLRRHGLRAATVTVKIRYGDFQTITRRKTLAEPTDSTSAIWAAARDLFDDWARRSFRPVRLIGVTASAFVGPKRSFNCLPTPFRIDGGGSIRPWTRSTAASAAA